MEKRMSLIVIVAIGLLGGGGRAAAQGEPLPGAADSLALVTADWHWRALGGGAEAGTASLHLFSSIQSISIIRFPMNKWRVEILERDGDKACTTSEMASHFGAAMALNGSYFNWDVTPATFVKDDGKVISTTSPDEEFRANGLLLIKGKRHTRLRIRTSLPSDNKVDSRLSREALSSGPMLVENGKVIGNERDSSNFFVGRHPRSFMGYTLPAAVPKGTLAGPGKPSGRMVYLVVVDGRFPGQADGATIPEAAFICRILGLHDAINLDGGGSSTLWDEGMGVLNHPYDNHVFDHSGERRVPNSVGVFQR
jgi:exopolysaccharide biosynthesis protein